jgi:hypothetical protein
VKINENVAGVLVLAALGVAGVWYLKGRVGAAANAVNPLNRENVFHKGVESVVGAENLSNASDYVFGAVDLINPFNESDDYAKKVYGLDFDWEKWLPDVDSWTMPQWDLSKVNPASQSNYVYEGLNKAVGSEKLATVGDYFFGAIDLINPFNKSDEYAKTVYGMRDPDYVTLKNSNSEGIK